MDTFLMICYVAATFGPWNGLTFSIKPNNIGMFVEAPAWIKETLMFKWLLKDGSIKVADETITRKQGENDPMEGMSASGKTEEVAEAAEKEIVEAAEAPAPKKTTRKKTAKKDDAE